MNKHRDIIPFKDYPSEPTKFEWIAQAMQFAADYYAQHDRTQRAWYQDQAEMFATLANHAASEAEAVEVVKKMFGDGE